jgi:hypothetical protein
MIACHMRDWLVFPYEVSQKVLTSAKLWGSAKNDRLRQKDYPFRAKND